jgi:hypothetical protein
VIRRLAIGALIGLVLAAGALGIAAVPANAYYNRYARDAIFSPGTSVGSPYNSLTYNAASFSNTFGGTPYVGTRYVRGDGTGYAFLWSNTGSIFDSRTVSYGQARCGASTSNQYDVWINFCDTGNG